MAGSQSQASENEGNTKADIKEALGSYISKLKKSIFG